MSSQQQALEHPLAGAGACIAEMRNMNAVTYNLPSETLSDIFEAGLSETSYPTPRGRAFLERFRQPLPVPFEIVISAVSRRWRNVALQTPRLWTDIYINFAQPTQALYDLYLYRSKTCLLDITLVPFDRKESDFIHSRDVGICFKQHMGLLIPHVVRWRELVIRKAFAGASSAPYAVLAHLYAPALETLVAEIHSQPRLAMEVFSGGAPRLSSVELNGVYFCPPQGAVKYLNLFYIYTGPLSHAQFSQLIRPMSSLTHVTINSTIFLDTNHPSIELQSVISLDISLDGYSIGALRFLDFPAVKKLTFRGYSHEVFKAVAQHRRLYPAVLSLTIASWGHSTIASRDRIDWDIAPVAKDFVSLLPSVRDVTFQGTDSTPMLHALHERDSTDKLLWSHLTAITVTPAVNATISLKKQTWTYVVKVVESRLRIGIPISHITLSSRILERISNKQQRRLREQVALIEC